MSRVCVYFKVCVRPVGTALLFAWLFTYLTVFRAEVEGGSTAGVLETATKRSLFDKRDEGSRRRRALGV